MTDREHYKFIQLHGLDYRAGLIRDDTRQLCEYARTLVAMRDNDDRVRGSISAARLALTEALLAVRLFEEEYARANLQAAE